MTRELEDRANGSAQSAIEALFRGSEHTSIHITMLLGMVRGREPIMLPTIGSAMRRITSEPVPAPGITDSRPEMIATTTVIAIGRRRSRASSRRHGR